jgi:hypothetical protein
MSFARAGTVALLASLGVAGCSGIGGSKAPPPVDPNTYPANYRNQIVALLTTTLTDPADFQGALIAPPVIRPVPEGHEQHYVVCLLLNGHHAIKNKVVIYLGGMPNEYVDATQEECAGASYQPFPELAAAKPTR